MRLKVRHNAEIAHRLSQSPGKCQQIHGHGLQIELVLMSLSQDLITGMARANFRDTLDFSDIKKKFRAYIDEKYDHHLLLNEDDPWAEVFYLNDVPNPDDDPVHGKTLPGLVTVPGDPTIENLCKWMALWSAEAFKCDAIIRIDETRTNGAEVMAIYGNKEATVR